MKKEVFEAVVTIQAARLRPQDYLSSRAATRDNPLVHLLIMVPKGDKDVTVPTNCVTTTQRRTLEPIWNESFSLFVLPQSDVLVFRVHKDDAPPPAGSPAAAAAAAATAAPALAPTEGGPTGAETDGRRMFGLCLLPVAHFNTDGTVSNHALEIFPRPNEQGVGTLFVAARVRRTTIDLLERKDLEDPIKRRRYHSARLSADTSRFLGIGELAAFLFEEGYSPDITANWNRALTLLAEQLAYRMWAATDSPNDEANFRRAKLMVERDGGLWDGV